MKKVILTTLIALSSLYAFTQDFTVSIYQVDVLVYDSRTEEYETYRTTYPKTMKLKKFGNMLTINNEDESNYRLGEKLNLDIKDCTSYLATDKDGVEMAMQFCFSEDKETGTVTALYLHNKAIVYRIKP